MDRNETTVSQMQYITRIDCTVARRIHDINTSCRCPSRVFKVLGFFVPPHPHPPYTPQCRGAHALFGPDDSQPRMQAARQAAHPPRRAIPAIGNREDGRAATTETRRQGKDRPLHPRRHARSGNLWESEELSHAFCVISGFVWETFAPFPF